MNNLQLGFRISESKSVNEFSYIRPTVRLSRIKKAINGLDERPDICGLYKEQDTCHPKKNLLMSHLSRFASKLISYVHN